ncbi:MFS transporter [Desulfuromonas acetoxidans]|uniref:Major facilitator superfamily MFS_1 n=1 Tax=Desulfuromonas acetoxidans (strain DSM 684 / 11070) TaxID=281689 RepID=Q1JWL5_DESA6|nr:MFS transporter [Desulfuromonas acetoxidans]EAT14664.1 major facilitator superfamily MFS_1 [Desulfuromonas acetoxidans DSM 684]MBF0645044.1 MFS transporter [Desulfuromonas acetoxidans]NVD23146.1 MFS transporter [Desulfuromonas acetoxidans]NVE15613.1 MFS transporter [Desulfuromonas acetoxidans]
MTSSQTNNPEPLSSTKGVDRKLPSGIWVLGFVSLFMDVSSELVHSLLPIFMTTVLGASMVTVGIIEGVAEGIAATTKVFSGALSDYFRKRKILVVTGYAIGALTKPVFPLATSIGWVFGARFVDRIGKGIRGAPRDALIADIAPPPLRGAAYGLRQALDSVGAFVGPLLAVVFMILFANDIKSVLWIAVIPAFIAVFLLIVALREPESTENTTHSRNHLTLKDAKRLPLGYWFVVILGAVFTLARFSEAFLILRAQDVGLAIGYVPAIMIVMNIVYSLFSYPAGVAADRLSARKLLVFGLGLLIVADVILAMAVSPSLAFVGVAFWGLHMAFTQGLLSKLVADTAPSELLGTAFGVFNLVSGGVLLLASVIAGSLWSIYGASATFIAGASFAALAALGLLFYRPMIELQDIGGDA